MDKITPHLWFDNQAKEAAELYTSLFDDSRIDSVTVIRDTPSGDCDVVAFTLAGQPFQAISAGPLFKFNPSISFLVHCGDAGEVDSLWNRLIDGGQALMPLDSYPFSERYGWLMDRYGLSWQIMLSPEFSQKIVPMLLFVGDVSGKAEEAIELYLSVFERTGRGPTERHGADDPPEREGTVKFADFTIQGTKFAAMDSAREHNFAFNEAISFMVHCDNQDEIDHFWDKLSAVPEAEQCGWLKDRYGLSWQIVPSAIDKMLADADEEAKARVTKVFLGMKKFDIAKLEQAYAGS